MDLGNIIKTKRKQTGQTQYEFATACGITQTYLSQIETNVKQPNISVLKTISDQLDIPLPVLFFLSMTEDDVPLEKRQAYLSLGPSVKSLINEFFKSHQ